MSKLGIEKDVPNSVYHNDTTHLSSSQLKVALENIERFKLLLDGELERTETANMRLGSAYHTLVLEPERWDSEVSTLDLRTKDGRNERDKMVEEHKDKLIITKDQDEVCQKMVSRLNTNADAKMLLQNGEAELSCYWTNVTAHQPLRIRPDYLNLDKGYIVDLKTTSAMNPDQFYRQARKLKYFLSAAMYIDGVKQLTGIECGFYYVVSITQPPYSCMVFRLSDASREIGDLEYEEALGRVKQARVTKRYELQDAMGEL